MTAFLTDDVIEHLRAAGLTPEDLAAKLESGELTDADLETVVAGKGFPGYGYGYPYGGFGGFGYGGFGGFGYGGFGYGGFRSYGGYRGGFGGYRGGHRGGGRGGRR